MSTFEGKMTQDGIKVGIVVARFNEFITSKLLGGAMDGLLRHDVKEQDIDVAWVREHSRFLLSQRKWQKAVNMAP